MLLVCGQILATRVGLSITAGLVELNKCLKETTVRVEVVIKLIKMLKDSGHVDFQRVCLREVAVVAQGLVPPNTPGDQATIPVGLEEVLAARDSESSAGDESDSDHKVGNDGSTDKAATPAERIQSIEELTRNMDRVRPQILLSQRDSDFSA